MKANSYDPNLPRLPRDPESPLYWKWGRYRDKDWLPETKLVLSPALAERAIAEGWAREEDIVISSPLPRDPRL